MSTAAAVLALIASLSNPTDLIQWQSDALKEPGIEWLAKNVYFEARAESIEGRIGIAEVTLSRVASKCFPSSIEAVVTQTHKPGTKSCQFSWTCDGKEDTIAEQSAWSESVIIAHTVKSQYGKIDDITNGAHHFHNDSVKPAWTKNKKLVVHTKTIGNHLFYREVKCSKSK